MHLYTLGDWTLVFDTEYRVIKDATTLVVLSQHSTTLVVASLKGTDFCIETATYGMTYTYIVEERLVKFLSERGD
ncbi:hypothetical protein ACR6HW_11010 [Fusibacter sp. JL298sf-3]